MGGRHSKNYLSESELSSPESDSEYFMNSGIPDEFSESLGTMQEHDVVDSEERTDAVLRNVSLPNPESVVTLEMVLDIEKELDDYEIVSLVYLLYDTRELALQELQLFVTAGKKKELLYRWAKNENYNRKRWQSKLIEALCIIQNYQVLKSMGYNKHDLQASFLPHRPDISSFVEKIRKCFYLIAEKLDKDQTIQFLDDMGKKLRERNFPIRINSKDYLELHFLDWEQNHLNIDVVKSSFKEMDLEKYYDILNSVVPPENPVVPSNIVNEQPLSPKIGKKPVKHKASETSTTRDTTFLQPGSLEYNLNSITPQAGVSGFSQEGIVEDINRYPVDPDNPGVLLIINQEHFYTEPDPKFQNLLHEDNDRIQLERREGTNMDEKKLENVFGRRGFRIVIKNNLTHYEVISSIQEVVMGITNESSLIVCILSHGDNGVVYGANSCKIDVNRIQNLICKRNKRLISKPKVLILQSCQGRQCQRIDEETSDDDDNANAKDGPNTIPATADLLTFWATIPGFAAIRNKNKGSWLIQELCDEIERSSPRHHFQDICTRSVCKVTSREWKERTVTNIMTPMVVTTLRKAFYLPMPRNN